MYETVVVTRGDSRMEIVRVPDTRRARAMLLAGGEFLAAVGFGMLLVIVIAMMEGRL